MCSQDAKGSVIPQRHKSTICDLPAGMARTNVQIRELGLSKLGGPGNVEVHIRSFLATKYPSKILTT